MERQAPSGGSPPSYNSEAFVVECPKESLVQKEGAPGVSTPITSSTGVRRFSLRPTVQSEVSQTAQAPSSLTKGLPRWRAGMLQRQINQINLQKRVRAFSLSDVHTEGSRGSAERTATPAISPLVDGVRIVGGPKDQATKSSSQKTVTIVSPRPEELAAIRSNDSKQCAVGSAPEGAILRSQIDEQQPRPSRTRVPFSRTISALNNPFASFVEARPAVGTNPFDFNAARRNSSEEASASTSSESSSIGTEATSTTTLDHSSANDPNSRTVYEALQGVKNIEASPTVSSSLENPETVSKPNDVTDSSKSVSISSGSTAETDSKGASRKVSAVSIGHWTDSRKPGSRKVSTVSQQSTDSASRSRKSSTNKSPGDKPRVSIDSYKPLMEVKIEKPSENPFERYKASVQISMNDGDSLTEVKVDSPESGRTSGDVSSEARRKISTKLGQDPRESTT